MIGVWVEQCLPCFIINVIIVQFSFSIGIYRHIYVYVYAYSDRVKPVTKNNVYYSSFPSLVFDVNRIG